MTAFMLACYLNGVAQGAISFDQLMIVLIILNF
jgi:hypothetical protein